MCLADGIPKLDDTLPGRFPARRARRRIQPLTWAVGAALMPVLLYDVWQTMQDVKQRHAARSYVALNPGSAATGR
jgi:hypothetical protein